MKSRMKRLVLFGIVSALGAGVTHAQSSPAAQAQVTQAVTVVAQREPVVTVLAPREMPSAVKTAKQSPSGIGKAVDTDGDGLADAPAAAARESAIARPSGKRNDPAAVRGPDCGDKGARPMPKSACARSNPQYEDKTAQGTNPLHKP